MKKRRYLILNTIVAGFLVVSAGFNVSSYMFTNDAQSKLNTYAENERVAAETIEALEDKLSIYTVDYDVPNPTPPRYLDVNLDKDTQSFIYSLCCNYDIAQYYELIFAIITVESNFNASTVSATNDYGLMQINKTNHNYLSSTLGITEFLDAHQDLHSGIFMIAPLLHKYNVADALMVYNMGLGGASKLWQRGIHTTQYTEKVLSIYNKYI